jgi:hypothetical protein
VAATLMAREDSIVQSIRAWLDTLPCCEHRKTHGDEYATKGDPDIIGCLFGRMFCIEVKQPGEEPTVLQAKRLRDWARAGAITGCAHSKAEAQWILGAWLEQGTGFCLP